MSLYFLTHDEPSLNYGATMIWTQFCEEYSANRNAVIILSSIRPRSTMSTHLISQIRNVNVQLDLMGSRRRLLQERVAPITKHLNETKGDYLLFVDAHSDYKSGELIYGRHPSGEEVSDSVDMASGSDDPHCHTV
jgi:hypothetical protein